jgi:hypothetical protein
MPELVTRTLEAYKYDELSETAKDRIRTRVSEQDAEIETENLTEHFAYLLSESAPYFTNPKFQWSLGHCQGDGLSFSCDIDMELFLKDKKMKRVEALLNYVTIKSTGNTGHYCYAARSDFESEIHSYRYLPRFEKLVETIKSEIKDKYMELCSEFEKYGYEAYENLRSDEYVKQSIEDRLFDSYGDFIPDND